MVHRMLPYIFIAASTTGCATISRGEPTIDDKLLRIERAVQQSRDVDAEVAQDQSTLHVQATWKCDLVEVRKIHRTSRYPKKNEALVPEVVLLGMGLIPAGIGAGMLADSKNVYSDDRQSRLYNPTGQKAAIGGGIALAVVGAAIMAVPVVDLFRSVGSTEEEVEVTENGVPIQRGVPCRGAQPAAWQGVLLNARGVSLSAGSTNAQGTLDVDLAGVVPASLANVPNLPATASVLLNGRVVGQVKLGPIIEARRSRDEAGEDQVWQSIDIAACKSRGDPTACQQVKSFLLRFPNGKHARDALRILDPSVGGGIQIAGSPEDIAKAEAAQKAAAAKLEASKKVAAEALEKAQAAAEAAYEKAQKAAEVACKKSCEASCQKDAACATACATEICP